MTIAEEATYDNGEHHLAALIEDLIGPGSNDTRASSALDSTDDSEHADWGDIQVGLSLVDWSDRQRLLENDGTSSPFVFPTPSSDPEPPRGAAWAPPSPPSPPRHPALPKQVAPRTPCRPFHERSRSRSDPVSKAGKGGGGKSDGYPWSNWRVAPGKGGAATEPVTLRNDLLDLIAFLNPHPSELQERRRVAGVLQSAVTSAAKQATVHDDLAVLGLFLPVGDWTFSVRGVHPDEIAATGAQVVHGLLREGYSAKLVLDAAIPLVRVTDFPSCGEEGIPPSFTVELLLDSISPLSTLTALHGLMAAYPQVRPIVSVIRCIVKQNEVQGGLSAHALVVMCAAMIKTSYAGKPTPSHDEVLLRFLKYYGKEFSFTSSSIVAGSPVPYVLDPSAAATVCDPADNRVNLTASAVAARLRQVRATLEYCCLSLAKWSNTDVTRRAKSALSSVVAYRDLTPRVSLFSSVVPPSAHRNVTTSHPHTRQPLRLPLSSVCH
eukprot:Sspe_Gene.20702::Locus_7626_Transcript_2_2_Confidence_0.500_Length_1600::g.20702::m.20702/K03514/PAPD5_7, TRF4; non-canonical poly(A) RNA polymerase PAPD5/7